MNRISIGDSNGPSARGRLHALGLGDHGAVLIRPDGYIAWRTDHRPADATTTLRDTLAIVTSRAP